MSFFQEPPRLGNQYEDDALLQEFLSLEIPPGVLEELKPEFHELGELGGGELYQRCLKDRLNEPTLLHWDPWGKRVDQLEVSPLWKFAERFAAKRGLVATGYDTELGEHSRTVQFIKNYLVQASLDVYSCPLAMTDGAARTLMDSGNQELIDRAVRRLTSRDPGLFWTSGQWMTERTGGSDVGASETVARKTDEGWRLFGTKWFTSATTAQMALTLARPEGNPNGGKGLALFYVEVKNGRQYNNILVNRLKDKLGTRKVPTAELTLDGTLAIPVGELQNGTRHISPMLNITRTWNAMGAAWGARRAVALVKDYAYRRSAFGMLLSNNPLHRDTVAGMIAEAEAIFHLAFLAAKLLCKVERGKASEEEQLLSRLAIPLAKLTTGKQAVALASEALECFGGAGYVEDTGLPLLLRDAQVLPIWEGTTNVLSVDVFRALLQEGSMEAYFNHVNEQLSGASDKHLRRCCAVAQQSLTAISAWLKQEHKQGDEQAAARRFALTLGRTLQLAQMTAHAQRCLEADMGKRAAAAARRFASHDIMQLDQHKGIKDADLLWQSAPPTV